MKITKATMTGADDSVNHKDLVQISKDYPFVEWGILLSYDRKGYSRYPSDSWLEKIYEAKEMNLSCHLCGKIVRNLLLGDDSFIKDNPIFFGCFSRMQLNFNSTKTEINVDKFFEKIGIFKQSIIFQYNNSNSNFIKKNIFEKSKNNYNILYDQSGGRGLLPWKMEWKKPFENNFTGYAGGLGPEVIENQLRYIEQVVQDKTIWIDMESRIRSDDGKSFDLEKVKKVLDVVKKYT